MVHLWCLLFKAFTRPFTMCLLFARQILVILMALALVLSIDYCKCWFSMRVATFLFSCFIIWLCDGLKRKLKMVEKNSSFVL